MNEKTTWILIGAAILVVLYFVFTGKANAATAPASTGPGGVTGISSGNAGAIAPGTPPNAAVTQSGVLTSPAPKPPTNEIAPGVTTILGVDPAIMPGSGSNYQLGWWGGND